MHRLFDPVIARSARLGAGLDWKTSLQELTAAEILGVPEYHVEESGPDHQKSFRASVRIVGRTYGEGEGRSKKEAEQQAAEAAWTSITEGHSADAAAGAGTNAGGSTTGGSTTGGSTTGRERDRREHRSGGERRRPGRRRADRRRPPLAAAELSVPELPEVEIVRRGLERHVVGRTIDAVQLLHPRALRRHLAGPDDFAAALRGRQVSGARRRGKYLWLPVGR